MSYIKSTIGVLLLLISARATSQYIDGGNQHTLILTQAGEVWAMGMNEYGEIGDSTDTRRLYPVRVKGLPPIKYISRGYKHSLAIDTAGNVWTWNGTTMVNLVQSCRTTITIHSEWSRSTMRLR